MRTGKSHYVDDPNNLDYAVQHPLHELITYGGNGAVSKLGTVPVDDEIPVGNDRRANIDHVFRPSNGIVSSHKEAPRVVVTNGMVIPIILNRTIGKNECFRRITIWANDSGLYVHRTQKYTVPTITVLNAFRKINRSPSGGVFLLQD
jgi:urocanate hydratase